jgi:hypothetical protein
MLDDVVIGNSCLGDTLSVFAKSTFACDATFSENVTFDGGCGKLFNVTVDTNFNCPVTFNDCIHTAGDLSVDGNFYICGSSPACGVGDGIEFPCPAVPGCGESLLFWDGNALTWSDVSVKSVTICEGGVEETYDFLIKGC